MELSTTESELITRQYKNAREAAELSTSAGGRAYWDGYCEALLLISDLAGAVKLPQK